MSETDDTEFWDTNEYIYWCLADTERTKAFQQAVRAVVRPGDRVVDLGAGTGVLGLTAAHHGAGSVKLVDIDPLQCKMMRRSVQSAPSPANVEVVESDAMTLELEGPQDVVICEMISTALVSEFQAQATNHVQQFCHEKTRFVPAAYRCAADLVYKPQPLDDPPLVVVAYDYGRLHPFDAPSSSMTEPFEYWRFDFAQSNVLAIDRTFELTVRQDGRINGLRLSGVSELTGFGDLGSTVSYSMPMILPLEERDVRSGQTFVVHLKYDVGGGLISLHYEVDPKRA